MPRLQLTDEEVKLVQEHRRKNEVRDAWAKAIDWCHDFLIENRPADADREMWEAFIARMVSTGRDVVLVEPRKKKS